MLQMPGAKPHQAHHSAYAEVARQARWRAGAMLTAGPFKAGQGRHVPPDLRRYHDVLEEKLVCGRTRRRRTKIRSAAQAAHWQWEPALLLFSFLTPEASHG